MGKPASINKAQLWKPNGDADVSLFKASFSTFTYDKHDHEEYAIGVVEQGVQHSHYKGTGYTAPPLSMFTVNPEEVHDGKGLTESYSYRMMYVGVPYLRSLYQDEFQKNGFHGFKKPLVDNPELAKRFIAIHRQLEIGDGSMDEILAPFLFEVFNCYAQPRPLSAPDTVCATTMLRAVDAIRASQESTPSLDALAHEAGLSKFHFLRMFRKQTGYTPHAYGLRHRVGLARKSLETGSSPSEAALAFGFSDQSHLTRRFKAMYGVTPGAFVRSI